MAINPMGIISKPKAHSLQSYENNLKIQGEKIAEVLRTTLIENKMNHKKFRTTCPLALLKYYS